MGQSGMASGFIVFLLLVACGGSEDEPREPARSEQTSAGVRELELEDQLQAELDIDDQPDWMATGFGSVWVTLDEGAAVARIDSQTNEVVAAIDIGGHPCNGIVADFGSVWVPSCDDQAVYRIDAETEQVSAVIEVPVSLSTAGNLSHELSAGAGSVWMMTEGTSGAFDALARIDPASNEVTATIPLGHEGAGVAATDEAVWVTAPDEGVLVRVDPSTEEVVAEIDGLVAPHLVAAGEEGVWVISGTDGDRTPGDGSVSRIDESTNTIADTITIDENPGQAGDIAVGEGFVYARTQYTLLAKIDPATNAIVERYTDQKGLGGVVVGFGSVWLSDFAFNNVWRVPA